MLEITTYNLQVRLIPENFNLQGTPEIHIAFLGPFLHQSFTCLMGQTFICLASWIKSSSTSTDLWGTNPSS